MSIAKLLNAACNNWRLWHPPPVVLFLVAVAQFAIFFPGTKRPFRLFFFSLPESYGWCGTIHNYTSFEDQRLNVTPSSGWGFCQKSCFPSPEEELGGVERFKVSWDRS